VPYVSSQDFGDLVPDNGAYPPRTRRCVVSIPLHLALLMHVPCLPKASALILKLLN
jgi:hypothetical protein